MSARWPKIFMYHAVTEGAEDPGLCVSVERFESQMAYLKRRGLQGVSMQELRSPKAGARNLVGLTFDDAYRNFLDNALPVLESFGFSATVFAVAGRLGEQNSWIDDDTDPPPRMDLLGPEGLRELVERGVEVGSHTMTHPRLGETDSGALDEEVNDSRGVLREILGIPVEGFCYPYGSLNEASVQAVRKAGYAYACAYKARVERSVYDLPRMFVGERDGPLRLTVKLKAYSPYARITSKC